MITLITKIFANELCLKLQNDLCHICCSFYQNESVLYKYNGMNSSMPVLKKKKKPHTRITFYVL